MDIVRAYAEETAFLVLVVSDPLEDQLQSQLDGLTSAVAASQTRSGNFLGVCGHEKHVLPHSG